MTLIKNAKPEDFMLTRHRVTSMLIREYWTWNWKQKSLLSKQASKQITRVWANISHPEDPGNENEDRGPPHCLLGFQCISPLRPRGSGSERWNTPAWGGISILRIFSPDFLGSRFSSGGSPFASTITLKGPSPSLLTPRTLNKYGFPAWRPGILYDVTLADRRGEYDHL